HPVVDGVPPQDVVDPDPADQVLPLGVLVPAPHVDAELTDVVLQVVARGGRDRPPVEPHGCPSRLALTSSPRPSPPRPGPAPGPSPGRRPARQASAGLPSPQGSCP